MIGFLKKHRHYGMRFLFVLLAASAVVDWLPLSYGVHKIVSYAFVPLVVAGILVNRLHDYGELCEQCAEETPLNPEKAVKRNRPWLKSFHSIYDDRRRFTIGSYVFLGLIVVSAIIFPQYSVGSSITTDLTAAVVAVLLLSNVSHRRLMPWCPWCHWGGDGRHEESPVVDPNVPVGA